jgi:hypothetical protein
VDGLVTLHESLRVARTWPGRRRRELSIEQIGRDRLVVIAHRRVTFRKMSTEADQAQGGPE